MRLLRPPRTVNGVMGRLVATALAFGAIGSAWACSNPAEPSTAPTLLVANPLCAEGDCRPVQVRAFVWGFKIPQSPIGIKVIGVVTGPSACFSFPDEWRLILSETDSTGAVVDSDTLTATSDGDVYIAVVDLETLDWLAATATFSPGSEPGWELDFAAAPPGDSHPYASHLKPSGRCQGG